MEINWNEILSAVLQAVLLFVLPPLAVAVYRWLSAKAKIMLDEARAWNPDVIDFLESAASFAVKAAEQAGAAEIIKDKKDYAVMVAQLWLAARSINVDLVLIEAAVEKAVREEINTD